MEQLGKQLYEAETSMAELYELRSCFDALGTQLLRWAPVIRAPTPAGASVMSRKAAESPVPTPRSTVLGIDMLLAQSADQISCMRILHDKITAEGWKLRDQLEVARRRIATLDGALNETRAQLIAAEQCGATLQASLKRSERIRGELQAEVQGSKRLLATFEEDREARWSGSEAVTATVAALQHEERTESHAEIGRLQAAQHRLAANSASLGDALAESQRAERAARVEVLAMAAARDEASEELKLAMIDRDALLARHADETMAGLEAAVVEGAVGGEDVKKLKVLHMTKNPASEAACATLESLRAKVRSLQLKLQAASGAAEKEAMPNCDASVSPHTSAPVQTAHIAALLELREVNASLLKQKDRLASVFKEKIDEFRKAVMTLTGYRVDLMERGRYHLYHSYAPRAAVLSFRTNKEGAPVFGNGGEIEITECFAFKTRLDSVMFLSRYRHHLGYINS